MMKTCSSCGALIRMVQTEKRRMMPIDVEPNPAGNIVLVRFAGQEFARVVGKKTTLHGTRYMPHWSTCPNAASHRRSRPCPPRGLSQR